jgi:hypothetical protein
LDYRSWVCFPCSALLVLLVLLVRETAILIWLFIRLAFELARLTVCVAAMVVVGVFYGVRWVFRVVRRTRQREAET